MPDKVEVRKSDPTWPDQFLAERLAIETALGRKGLAFEHVGSTAVPGLAAKPTIDVMIGSADGKVDALAIAAFQSLGYGFLGEKGVSGRQLFRKGLPPTHHVHWTTTGSPFWSDQLAFRDFMRTHPSEAREYEALKRELAERFSLDRESYTKAKGDFITRMLARARDHARGCRRIVFDLEATCWEKGTDPARQEVIEIGAVELDARLEPIREFRTFVRPTREPRLSDFCTKLTGIKQSDVDPAEPFAAALARFVAWIGPAPFELCSWSGYDLEQLRAECVREGVALPAAFERHVDLQLLCARVCGSKPEKTAAALARLGLTAPKGAPHRALEDSRDIARLARVLLGPKTAVR